MMFRYLTVQVLAARAFRSSPAATTAKGNAFRWGRLATSATALHSTSTLADSTATGANGACVDESNPLLASWDAEPYNLPPFSKVWLFSVFFGSVTVCHNSQPLHLLLDQDGPL